MKKRYLVLPIIFAIIWGRSPAAEAMTGDQVARLKQAGVSDRTIQLMIQEKSIPTVSVTVQEVVDMKASGISEETLQMLIKELSYIKDSKPIIYGEEIQNLQISSANDLIRLKEAGFSDDILRAIVTVNAADPESQSYEKALELLKRMHIWVTPPPQ
jgi:hypothetical protein